MSKSENIEHLFQRFAIGEASREEFVEFYERVKDLPDEDLIHLMDAHFGEKRISENASKVDWDFIFEQIIKQKSSKTLKLWPKIAIAASIVLIIGAAIIYITNKQSDEKLIVNTRVIKNDVRAPEITKAILTLADGSSIVLDSTGMGTIAMQGAATITKSGNGEIIYTANRRKSEMQYNTLTVPRGSRIASIVLSDGSKVFLNSESSLKYPVAFNGKERRISITGEAYFEIAKDASKPFIVNVAPSLAGGGEGGGPNRNRDYKPNSEGGPEIKVLGTNFNVNNYTDNPLTATLLQGSIKINNTVLKPGEAFENGNIVKADTNQAVAWKNGQFIFKGTSLESVMAQLARWYNLTVSYKEKLPIKFYAKIPRSTNVSEVLKMLELTGKVHFSIEGNKIIVMR